MKVLFRVDANPHIATGHVMRCLSIADALQESGHEAVFVSARPHPNFTPESRGHRFLYLNTDYRHTTKEIPKFLEVLSKEAPDIVLVDSYFTSYKFMTEVRKRVPIVYIDDLCEKALSADGLINYNIYGPYMDYDSLYKGKAPELLLGPMNAPLRKEFSNNFTVPEKDTFNFLVSSGGSDPYHVAKRVADIYLGLKDTAYKNITLSLLVGGFSKDLDYLKSLEEKNPGRIKVYTNIVKMAEFLAKFSGAASAAGSTVYELCAMKVPAILYSTAHNQENINKYFSDLGIFKTAGNMQEDEEKVIKNILSFMKELYESPELQASIKEKESTVTDGNGAGRIVDFLIKVKEEKRRI